MNRSRLVTSLLLLAALASGAALQAAGPQSRIGEGADLAAKKTYRWKTEQGPQTKELDRQLREAADEQLAKEGLKKVAVGEPADMELRYNAGAADALVAGLDIAAGYWGDLVGIPGSHSTVRGGMVFLLENPENGEVFWAGWIVKEGTTMSAPQVMRKRAPKWAKQILSRYPN